MLSRLATLPLLSCHIHGHAIPLMSDLAWAAGHDFTQLLHSIGLALRVSVAAALIGNEQAQMSAAAP